MIDSNETDWKVLALALDDAKADLIQDRVSLLFAVCYPPLWRLETGGLCHWSNLTGVPHPASPKLANLWV